MLETIVTGRVMFYLTGVVIAAGIAAKMVVGISLRRLVKAAGNMGKSNHAFMRLVRAKFEHACMVSDKVQNVRAFVEKYMYECKTLGIRLHAWRHFEKTAIWLCLLCAAVGAALANYELGMGTEVYRYGIVGGAGAFLLLMLRVTADEQYQLEAAKNYMVDFLENTYAHRYAKTNQREIQVTVQPGAFVPEEPEADGEPLVCENEKPEVVAASAGAAAVQRAEVLEEPTGAVPYYEPQIQEVPQVQDPMVQPNRMPVQEPKPSHSPQPAPAPKPAPEISPLPETEPVRQTAEEPELPKEARIREILEEFLA